MLVSRANRRLLTNKMLKTRRFTMTRMLTIFREHPSDVQRYRGKIIVPFLRAGGKIYTGAGVRSGRRK
jgi:hypothetical protein